MTYYYTAADRIRRLADKYRSGDIPDAEMILNMVNHVVGVPGLCFTATVRDARDQQERHAAADRLHDLADRMCLPVFDSRHARRENVLQLAIDAFYPRPAPPDPVVSPGCLIALMVAGVAFVAVSFVAVMICTI